MAKSGPDTVDLVVVGAGMAGINAAARASATGARVVVIERDRVGGTCPIRGCIPSKALIRCAEVAHEVARAGDFGIRVGRVEVDFAAVMDRVRRIIDKGAAGARGYLESLEGVELVEGEARLAGAEAVEVGGRTIRAPRILLATGAEAATPPIPGLEAVSPLTSDDLFGLGTLPGRILVVGAGPIALEMGQALHRLGARVTMVEVAPRLLPGVERPLADELGDLLREEGIEILVGAEIQRLARVPGGVRMDVAAGGAARVLEGDAVLVAAGRRACVGPLGLDAAGVAVDRRGVVVDARLRSMTSPTVWAAGDVLGPEWGQYTHVARRQGESAAANALDDDPHDVPHDVGPRAVFTDPELVSIGLTEEEAREQGHEVAVGTGEFSGGKARAWGQERGRVTVIAERGTGRLLGAHVLAYHGADLIHPVAVAMRCGDGTGAPLVAADHVHPTLGEVVKSAVAASQP